MSTVTPKHFPVSLPQTYPRVGSVFSVSGPVIIAEHMIGCAMYELVCLYIVFILPLLNPNDVSRFESVTTSLSARLSG